jgi:hypothetical protein
MTAPPPGLPAGAAAVAGPERWGSELRWRVRLADGSPALLASLAPELARDEVLRRRYRRDVARVQTLAAPCVAEVLATGPDPSDRDTPPWRLRRDPPGETLETWLTRRAPAPLDEAVAVAIDLAECLRDVHARGGVLRDLHPRLVVRDAGRTWLTDIGLARVDVLSTRTAASLLLEGSPYASPEQFERTALDPRADLYTIGVVLYLAICGELPRGDGPALFAEQPVVPPSAVRPEVSPALDRVILRCLARDPADRPSSADELAEILRGNAPADVDTTHVPCQSCGAALRLGQRLCLACGQLAVQFDRVADGTHSLLLTSAKEDSEFLARLRARLGPLSDAEVPALNLLIGDARMYSTAERERRHALPVRLFDGLTPATAEALRRRLKADGFAVRVRDRSSAALRRRQRKGAAWTWATTLVIAAGVTILGAPTFVLAILLALGAFVHWSVRRGLAAAERKAKPPLLQLRAAPAALPASDPLVARLATLLNASSSKEVRALVGGLALAVQRLVDHRAAMPGAAAEIDVLTAPVAPLVEMIHDHVTRLQTIDRALADLDEGTLVRALATSEARGDPPARRAELLAGLDQLRALEDERGLLLHQLLDTDSLLRRAIDVGLETRDDAADHALRVAHAARALR